MLHLSSQTGLWSVCDKTREQCLLKYHAPVNLGDIPDSLLWEMYASEELHRPPTLVHDGLSIWKSEKGTTTRKYGLPCVVSRRGLLWNDKWGNRIGYYSLRTKKWSSRTPFLPAVAEFYVDFLLAVGDDAE